MMKKFLFLACICLFTNISLHAQCKIKNTFFQEGENLEYDLYFKYGLIYTKAGGASLKTSQATVNGANAYKSSLVAASSGAAKKFFSLNDTITSYMSKDISPLKYVKNAHEGKDYTQEELIYSYPSKGGVSIKAKRTKNGVQKFDEVITKNGCTYDLVSVLFYARTLDYSSMKKGDVKSIQFISGKNDAYMVIEHDGIENVNGNDDRKYECIKLILSISVSGKNAFEDKKEAMKVYITNDNNRIPIRLDSKLKVGSTRAILKSYRGNKYTVKTAS